MKQSTRIRKFILRWLSEIHQVKYGAMDSCRVKNLLLLDRPPPPVHPGLVMARIIP